jgi:hypothetical protein
MRYNIEHNNNYFKNGFFTFVIRKFPLVYTEISNTKLKIERGTSQWQI